MPQLKARLLRNESSFPLVLVLEIPSVKTAGTDSIAFCDSFSQGDIQARRTTFVSDDVRAAARCNGANLRDARLPWKELYRRREKAQHKFEAF